LLLDARYRLWRLALQKRSWNNKVPDTAERAVCSERSTSPAPGCSRLECRPASRRPRVTSTTTALICEDSPKSQQSPKVLSTWKSSQSAAQVADDYHPERGLAGVRRLARHRRVRKSLFTSCLAYFGQPKVTTASIALFLFAAGIVCPRLALGFPDAAQRLLPEPSTGVRRRCRTHHARRRRSRSAHGKNATRERPPAAGFSSRNKLDSKGSEMSSETSQAFYGSVRPQQRRAEKRSERLDGIQMPMLQGISCDCRTFVCGFYVAVACTGVSGQ
jgi:hypothetical protein